MDKKGRIIWYVCLFTGAGIWTVISSADISFTSSADISFTSSADISFTKYHHESSLADYRCVPNETAFEMDDVFDPVQCGKLCYLGNMCRSFFYQPDSHKCIGCRISSQKLTCRQEPYPGSKYFRSKQGDDVVLASVSDCKDLLEKHCYMTSGQYEIRLWKSKKVVKVFCDMDTDGGGWTVFQNRFDGSTDFYRNFSDYENGFGELSGEFWLGLEALHEMTSQGKTELRVDLTAADDSTAYETFQHFNVDESPSYTLRIGPGNGTLGDGEKYSLYDDDGGHFTTYDVDQDTQPSLNMAVETNSGWWLKLDTRANLNGKYLTPRTKKEGPANVGIISMYYYNFQGWVSLISSKMMFRRVNM